MLQPGNFTLTDAQMQTLCSAWANAQTARQIRVILELPVAGIDTEQVLVFTRTQDVWTTTLTQPADSLAIISDEMLRLALV